MVSKCGLICRLVARVVVSQLCLLVGGGGSRPDLPLSLHHLVVKVGHLGVVHDLVLCQVRAALNKLSKPEKQNLDFEKQFVVNTDTDRT